MMNLLWKVLKSLLMSILIIVEVQCAQVKTQQIENWNFSLIAKCSKSIFKHNGKSLDEAAILECVFDDNDTLRFGIRNRPRDLISDKPFALLIYDSSLSHSRAVPFGCYDRKYFSPIAYKENVVYYCYRFQSYDLPVSWNFKQKGESNFTPKGNVDEHSLDYFEAISSFRNRLFDCGIDMSKFYSKERGEEELAWFDNSMLCTNNSYRYNSNNNELYVLENGTDSLRVYKLDFPQISAEILQPKNVEIPSWFKGVCNNFTVFSKNGGDAVLIIDNNSNDYYYCDVYDLCKQNSISHFNDLGDIGLTGFVPYVTQNGIYYLITTQDFFYVFKFTGQ